MGKINKQLAAAAARLATMPDVVSSDLLPPGFAPQPPQPPKIEEKLVKHGRGLYEDVFVNGILKQQILVRGR